MIKIYSGDYDRSQFYALMGQFFAEAQYQKQLPYLVNREETVWYLNVNKNQIEAFSAVEILEERIHFRTDYFLYDIGYLDELITYRFNHLPNKPIDTAVTDNRIRKLFISRGFVEYRRTKNYTFMIREALDDEKD